MVDSRWILKVEPSGFADVGGGLERGTETERDMDDPKYFDLSAWATKNDPEAQRGRRRCPGCT